MIQVRIQRTEPVSEEAATLIAAAFGEWLDKQGFELVADPNRDGTRARTDPAFKNADYKTLAQDFIEEWG